MKHIQTLLLIVGGLVLSGCSMREEIHVGFIKEGAVSTEFNKIILHPTPPGWWLKIKYIGEIDSFSEKIVKIKAKNLGESPLQIGFFLVAPSETKELYAGSIKNFMSGREQLNFSAFEEISFDLSIQFEEEFKLDKPLEVSFVATDSI